MNSLSFLGAIVAVGATTALGGLASAQSPLPVQVKVLVKETDVFAGIGNVTLIDNLAVNDQGTWLVEVDTDHADANKDRFVLRNGAIYLREGDALPALSGTTIKNFDAINLDSHGHSAFNLNLTGNVTLANDSGVFYDADLQMQKGSISTAIGFGAGTLNLGWFEAKASDSGAYVMVGSFDDPATASASEGAITLGMPAPGGGLGAEVVVWKDGDVLPGQTEWVASFRPGPHSFAINATNQVMCIADLNGDVTKDGAIYVGPALVAQEGSPSPVAGRNWLTLLTASVDVNDAGDYVHTGTLDGDTASNLLIARNGQKLVQKGDALPAIAPFKITGFGSSAPVAIDRDGNVVWFGKWDDPDTSKDSGLFFNDQLLVQEGVTLVGGAPLQTIAGVQDAFSLSDDGRFLVFEGTFAGDIEAALLLTPAGAVTALPGCAGNAGSLAFGTGTPSIGSPFTLTLDAAQATPSFALLAIAGAPALGGSPCGFVLPGMGEVLVAIAPAPFLQGAGMWTGSAVAVSLAVPANVSLVDAHVWFQGAFSDVLGTSSEGIRLTNGLEIRIGGAL